MGEEDVIKHIVKNGSREHVVWYDNQGAHCSELNCEFNLKSKGESNDKKI